jgi:hypothetical protein
MASSPSRNNGIPFATVLSWYKIRDTFWGLSFSPPAVASALKMAEACDHPDALWLTETCAGKNVKSLEDAKRVFSALGQNDDARTLCFLWLCGEWSDLEPLRRSAELGFAFAEALMVGETSSGEDAFQFAQLAAAQGEREGFFQLGWCLQNGEGCEEDLDKARENFLLASELGHVLAMCQLGEFFPASDPQRWQWWGRAAFFGFYSFLRDFPKQVELFNSGSGSAHIMFLIGQALHGHINEKARKIFNQGYDFDLWIGPAKQAIAFYDEQIKATKDVLYAWTHVGIQYNVVKDVRKLIARLIWDSKEETLFKR